MPSSLVIPVIVVTIVTFLDLVTESGRFQDTLAVSGEFQEIQAGSGRLGQVPRNSGRFRQVPRHSGGHKQLHVRRESLHCGAGMRLRMSRKGAGTALVVTKEHLYCSTLLKGGQNG